MDSKTMHVGVVLSVLAYVTIVSGADLCPANLQRSTHLKQFNGKCYEFIFNHPGDWYHANSDCRKKGGVLVDIIDDAEQHFIYNSLRFLNFANDKGVWIGLTDEPSEGKWRWASGQYPTYTHWASGQPGLVGRLEDCALFDFKDFGFWNDYPCHGFLFNTQNHGWVCKYNMVQPPSTAVPVTTPMPAISTAMPLVASSSSPTPTPPTKSPITAGFETRAPMTTAGFETRAPVTPVPFIPCPAQCPPSWTSMLNNPLLPTPTVNGTICMTVRQQGVISTCQAGNTCSQNVVPFYCCPSHCLGKIPLCLPNEASICVPSDIQPFQAALSSALLG